MLTSESFVWPEPDELVGSAPSVPIDDEDGCEPTWRSTVPEVWESVEPMPATVRVRKHGRVQLEHVPPRWSREHVDSILAKARKELGL